MTYTLDDFRPECISTIRAVVDQHVIRTPLVRSAWLSQEAGLDVFLKCENLQVTGAFKVRGAVAALSRLNGKQRKAGVITASTGNHGAALAYAARALNIPCRVALPSGTPQVKKDRMLRYGAEIVESPARGYDATQAWVLEEYAGAERFISPFEDPWVVAGNGGTTGLEILESLPSVREIITPIGGGGLGAGLGLALSGAGVPVRLTGVNTEACPSMVQSFREGEAVLVMEGASTLADAIEGGVGALTYQLVRHRFAEVRLVREPSLERAIYGLARHERMIVEGAGATGVASLLEGYRPQSPCVILLSGGNIDRGELRRLFSLSPSFE